MSSVIIHKLKKISQFVLICTLAFSWVFSGWPQIFNFPPKIQEAQATTETFITAGTFTNGWTAPADVFSVTAETWGGGGGSGGGTVKNGPGGSGGGGGAYASKVISVTPGNSYTYVVGAAGLVDGGTAGGNSSFTGNASVQNLACGGTSGAGDGGTAGAGGTTACSDGTAEFAGGAGATGAGTSGGGGGESAGTTATGGSAIGTAGGTGTDGTDGSAGQLANFVGVAGNNPGAGAGGAGGRTGASKVGASGGVGQVKLTYVAITAALTGTVTESITEADIVTGGKTIILTLTNDTWVAAGATFDAQRQAIINGIDSAQVEGTGWDAEVKAKEVVGAVVRTSDTVVTFTLTAQAGYNITATETITATIPATALVAGNAIVATPTFAITAVAPSQTLTFSLGANSLVLGTLSASAVTSGSHTITVGTNATNGVAVTYSGSTLTSGGNTITAMSTAAASSIGTEQFGINAKDNATPNVGLECSGTPPIAAAATGYATVDNFKFVSGETIVSSAGSINDTTCTISYIANITTVTDAGSYSATLTYTATAQF